MGRIWTGKVEVVVAVQVVEVRTVDGVQRATVRLRMLDAHGNEASPVAFQELAVGKEEWVAKYGQAGGFSTS